MTIAFETTDMEAAHHMLNSLYGKMRLTLLGDRQLVRVTQDQLGLVRLHRTTFPMDFGVDGTPLRTLAFGHVRAGTLTYHRGRVSVSHRAGESFLAAQPEAPYTASLHDADLEWAFLDPILLTQVAEAVPARTPQPVRFTAYQPVTSQAGRLWAATHAYVRDNIAGTPAAGEPLLAGQAARLLVATALVTFPSTALYDPTIEDRHDAHPATLRRAVSFIDDNAERDICAADIATAVHVTIRTLQLAFRRHLDTTPMAYLRRVRLEHAHRELIAANSSTATVSTVAARWGFASHSRFAAAYRAAYGVHPSWTLRQT